MVKVPVDEDMFVVKVLDLAAPQIVKPLSTIQGERLIVMSYDKVSDTTTPLTHRPVWRGRCFLTSKVRAVGRCWLTLHRVSCPCKFLQIVTLHAIVALHLLSELTQIFEPINLFDTLLRR
jgi:hypothetical protein